MTRRAFAASAALALSGCSLLLPTPERKDAASSSPPPGGTGGRGGNAPTGPFRHVYFCGSDRKIAAALFPHEFEPRTSGFSELEDGPEPTRDDLLIAGYANAEKVCGKSRPELNGRILNFPGRMMFFNVEAADTQGGPRPAVTAIGAAGGGEDIEKRPMPDACLSLPGEMTCHVLQGTVASDVSAFEVPGGRFDYLPPSDRAYVFGPHPDTPRRSIRVSVAARQWLHGSTKSMRWMWDPSRKPVNTGEYFAVFLASSCIQFRDEAAQRIARIGEVHVGDNWRRNSCDKMARLPSNEGTPPLRIAPQPDHTPRSSYRENSRIMSKYKFAIVMENTYREGYITEKIMNAFKSGAVPIWYGGRDALDIFNPESFVFYDVENPEPALQRIRDLLEHPEAYKEVLRAPILKDGNRTVEEYFSLRDDIGGGRLKNRIRRLIGMDDEKGNT